MRQDEDGVTLDNAVVRVRIDADGLVRSVYDLRAHREALAPDRPGNAGWCRHRTLLR
ncbi:hypothetical protein [Actinacidiphila soli]|uniref:hypothetical protein n=1 Tax=Actinacidiphila soli TaxID=2487275 RepID=UPI000FCCB0E8|nr:hypothetical protein [Actinacidiphila soli]